jgi:hypothetical protein
MQNEKQKNTPLTPAGFIDEPHFLQMVPICRRTAANLRKAGKLPHIKLGKRILYHAATIEQWLLRQQRGGEQ